MSITKSRLWIAAVVFVLAVAAAASAAYAAGVTGSGNRGPGESRTTTAEARQTVPGAKREKPYVETRLYFGTGRHGGKPPVTDEQFLGFVDKYVTPRFPSGLTLERARGQWRDRAGHINRGGTYVLSVLYPRSQFRDHDGDIEKIRSAYKHAYGQESVLRTDDAQQADF